MSENIRGVTFAEQTVTPADDAIVRRAILSDGILSGCNITYSGSTLTMAAGYMIVCGRIFQITAAQNWAVVDATSGVARLVLTIDLTKTATESAFDQIGFSIEYATAENGFVNLTQDDINIAGIRYQVAVVVVSLGAGGITSIVSKLEKAEGGGGLNFKVVGGLTQPAGPKENTIWVQTETKITSWIFSASEPTEATEGMVWFLIGTSSASAFSVTKKNPIMIYPLSAKQYVSGSWQNATAKSFQGGRWVDWVMYLYNNGDECLDVTGGWQALAVGLVGDGWGTLEPTLEKNADHMRIQMPYTDKTGIVETVNTIDLTRGTTLVASFECSIKNSDYDTTFIAVYQDGESPWSNPVAKLILRDGDTSAEIDISSLSGLYKICFGVTTNSLGFTDYTEIIVRSVCVK